MLNGYYWITFSDGRPPEVIEILGPFLHRCGSDVMCTLENGDALEFCEPLGIARFIGPLIPP